MVGTETPLQLLLFSSSKCDRLKSQKSYIDYQSVSSLLKRVPYTVTNVLNTQAFFFLNGTQIHPYVY